MAIPASRPSGFDGWSEYFPEDQDSYMDKRVPTINSCIKMIRSNLNVFLGDKVKQQIMLEYRVPLNLEHVIAYGERSNEPFAAMARDIQAMIFENPEDFINMIGCAFYQIIYHCREITFMSQFNRKKIHVRITGFEKEIRIKHLKSILVGKFVRIQGNCVRCSGIKPLVKCMDFTCKVCGETKKQNFEQGRYKVPYCTACKKNAKMAPDKDSVVVMDWQQLKIQEIPKKGHDRIPKSVQVDVYNDMVSACIPGDIVTCYGVVEAMKTEIGGRDKKRSIYQLYIQANNVQRVSLNIAETGGQSELFSGRDLLGIRKIADLGVLQDLTTGEKMYRPGIVLRQLVHSIAPVIAGHNLVKAGLVLTLMGGVPRSLQGMTVRPDVHMMMVGDPGMGKSQLLKAVMHVAPRGVYVCGNSTTAGGITATVSGADGTLEAGALVLGDQGICCIDEFDKMKDQHGALLEAMEQQTISIAKAGTCCTLASRTAVIAAANPVEGHYNKRKSVSENLKMNPALVSRFDLLFIMMDDLNEDRDAMLSEHIMNLHRRPEDQVKWRKKRNRDGVPISQRPAQQYEGATLRERLELDDGDALDKIPTKLFKKYVAYARKYCQPKLNREAKKVIKEFYIELRKRHKNPDAAPITTRQLCSLIRLTEARAKCELRETATALDAKDAVEIVRESMIAAFSDDLGCVDFTRSKGYSGTKLMREVQKSLREYGRMAVQNGQEKAISRGDLRQMLRQFTPDVDDLIEKLRDQTIILLKRGGRYTIEV